MVCFINRSTVDYDVRLQKYVQACIETNTPYMVLAWDRLKNCEKVYPNEIQYKVYCPYGAGKKGAFAFLGWIVFVIWNLIRHFNAYKTIHACNIENCLIAYWTKFFGKKLVFDIYDSANTKLEHKISPKVQTLILPHELRLEPINLKESELKRLMIVENVPVFHEGIAPKKNVEFPKIIHLSYVGIFEKSFRGLENLLELVASDKRFILDIAGSGGGLDEVVKQYAQKCSRIKYHGKVQYSEALKIMNESDFIVAMYYLLNPIHKYASPNKFYESLYLGKPIITSKNTLVGKRVESDNTGYTIDDTLESLKSLFDQMETEDFMESYQNKVINCQNRWSKTYQNYFEQTLKGEYVSLIKQNAGL